MEWIQIQRAERGGGALSEPKLNIGIRRRGKISIFNETLFVEVSRHLFHEKQNLRWNSSFNLPVVEGTNEDLSWFGKFSVFGLEGFWRWRESFVW